MSLIFSIIGALIGGMLTGFTGIVLGGGAGLLLGYFSDVRGRLNELEKEVSRLRYKVEGEEAKTAEQQVVAATADHESRRPPIVPTRFPATPVAPEKEPARHDLRRPEFVFEQRAEQPADSDDTVSSEPPPFFLAIASFFTSGNLLVKTGMVILFFGVSFLAKYAAEHGLLPIELRLAACALGGIALLVVGWRMRNTPAGPALLSGATCTAPAPAPTEHRAEYSLTLQGGGIGVLYLTCYAAFRLYHLIPELPAFGLLLAVSLLCGVLAVKQDSRTLALFGICGGFLAPLLASTGQGSHVILFGYYVVLNAVIIGIAWFKSWRHLNLAGFIFTFLIGAFWGAKYYQPAFFASTEPFLVIFFLIYVAVAVLFALRQPSELKGYLDGTLIFGTPVVCFGLQASLVADYRYGLAWSALIVGLFYMLLFWVLSRRELAMNPLAEAFRAFGVIFLTLTFPLAFDGRWTAAAWALEGAAIAWIGIRQERPAARIFGYLLQAGAGAAFCSELLVPVGPWPVLNMHYLGCLLISLSGLWTAYALYRESEKLATWEYTLSHVLIGWGLLWWLGGGLSEIGWHLSESYLVGGQLLFITATCGACQLLERRLFWQPLTWPALAIVPALWCFALLGLSVHPLENGGWFGWPAAFALLYTILYLQDDEHPELLPYLHAAALWLFAILATLELGWQIRYSMWSAGSWLTISRGIVPALLLLVMAMGADLLAWPIRRHENTYYTIAAVPLALWSWLWILLANLTDRGNPAPFPWWPLLNTLDLTTALSLLALTLWYRCFRACTPNRAAMIEGRVKLGCAATGFFWLNAILVRGLHHWGGVPFDAASMFQSGVAQTSFAIFWSLLALCTMVLATKRGMRVIWLAGAGLLGVVVVKLFLIDLAGHGSIERIVSFVAVGLLLLVIGWFAPVPPRDERL